MPIQVATKKEEHEVSRRFGLANVAKVVQLEENSFVFLSVLRSLWSANFINYDFLKTIV